MSEDKRKNPRIDIQFQVIHVGLKRERPHTVRDLSMGGLFIETAEPSAFRQEDEIEIVMREPADNKLMCLEARVVYVGKDGIGVELLNLSDEDRQILQACFDLFRHTLPQFNS
jgi:c-di-GMP-binding flagellar brake protein YcgR